MFRLSNYWALGLLILIPYALYMSKKSLVEMPSWRRWSTFGLRSAVILLLILSLAGFQLVWNVDKLCVIFALDGSSSIPENEFQRALEFTRNAMERIKDSDQAGLVSFGGEAYVEIPPVMKPEITKMPSVPSGDYTNLETAVKVAANLFPDAVQKRIVLVSDGNENVGNVMDEAAVAKSSDIEIYTVPVPNVEEGVDEVMMDGLIGPGSVNLRRVFELKAVVKSTVDAKAILKLFRDRDYVGEKEVQLSAGKRQVFTFPMRLDREGVYVYEVLMEPSVDTIRENNRAKALVLAAGKPKVLYVTRDNIPTDYLYRVLIQKGMEVVLMTDPSRIPTSLSEMQNYGVVVFNDIPAYSLSAPQMRMIESYVHNLGGGFIMIGGENSFGSGEYYKTPVENVLPVKMIPERKKRSLSIVMAIDRSGSMAVSSGRNTKIDLAKEAAISAVEALTDKDQAGVIAFDVEAQEIVKLESVRLKGRIEDKIGKIRARGGTDIYPALDIAYRWLKSADTQLKHVLLVSDGRSQQPDRAYPLVRKMAQDKITVSTIAIGDDSGRETMRHIADLGMGRYYEIVDAGDLPRIFVKEAFVASELIMEGNFQPVVSEDSEVLKGLDRLPLLRGYVGTSPKDNASVLIMSDAGDMADPILATWQYGLGRSLAFTSDAKPRWAVEWLKWDDFGKFWSQAIAWCLTVPAGEFDVSTSISGGTGHVAVDAVDAQGRFRNFLDFQAQVVKPDMSSEKVSLNQSGPGRYDGEFNAGLMGNYLLRVSEMKSGKVISSRSTGSITSYSPEYKDLKANQPLLENLAKATGGKFNPQVEEIAAHGESNVWQLRDIWHWLVLVSLPLFFLDVALRRITISKEQISEFLKKLHLPRREATSTTIAGTMANLKLRKAGIFDVQTRRITSIHQAVSSSQLETKSDSDMMDLKTAPEPGKAYTARLLEAKKRAGS